MPQYMRWENPRISGIPTIKNHTAVNVDNTWLIIFGGYDGRKNHNILHRYNIISMKWEVALKVGGRHPVGRNGHTATLVNKKVFIIGGWLGNGPLAANDILTLDVSDMDKLAWIPCHAKGIAPGPCNMHTAEYMPELKLILIFRGGDGREYLNDLHAYHVERDEWMEVECSGEKPIPRANHSAAVVDTKMVIFGGWDGHKRLNDLHILDTTGGLFVWSQLAVAGSLIPEARAGMTLTAIRGQLFLFGGSGPAAKCFNDLQILVTGSGQPYWRPIVTVSDTDMSEDTFSLRHRNFTNSNKNTYDSNIPSSQTVSSPHLPQTMDANPNEEEGLEDSLFLVGQGPNHRAGHTATAVGRKLIILGGSYGTEYLQDLFVLDIDPLPSVRVTTPSCLTMIGGLRQFVDSDEFADVVFLVEGRKVFAHRIVLSVNSDKFRAMFRDGFLEARLTEIPLPHTPYGAFISLLEYLYTGQLPTPCLQNTPLLLELLSLTDQFLLEHLKETIEAEVANMLTPEMAEMILQAAESSNAFQLRDICLHLIRNHTSTSSMSYLMGMNSFDGIGDNKDDF